MSEVDDLFGDSDNGPVEDEDEIELTGEELVARITTAWINERQCPEILPSQSELIECLLEQIRITQEALRSQTADLKNSIKHLEVDRLRYLCVSYLRTRLHKIEDQVFHVLQDPSAKASLSVEEQTYAEEYINLIEKQMNRSVLDNLPQISRKFEISKFQREPDLDQYVFAKVNKAQRNVMIDPDDAEGIVDLEPNAQYLLNYRPIAQLLKDNAVSLI